MTQDSAEIAELLSMVTLHTVRRVLAVDLGLDAQAIERHLARSVPGGEHVEAHEIPLADALRIVADAASDALAA